METLDLEPEKHSPDFLVELEMAKIEVQWGVGL
jgi:hypothetical protein